jgi:beta-glucosidase
VSHTLPFPDDFIWGVATSSYQIEGAVNEGGRGPSIWDTFCATPGKVADGDNGDVACDHYNRYDSDIDIMKALNVAAYRFSVAWPRIFPVGTETTPNEAGLDFYDRLVDGLLARGITPWVTLYHWDLPQGLEDLGGWRNRKVVEAFERYTAAMATRLGDRVKHWITHNEPWCVASLGHELGEHAPGLKDGKAMLAAAHHVLLSHGRAVPIIRNAVDDAKVGITVNLTPGYPASDSAEDAAATKEFDGWFNRWYLDPLYGRGYPEDMFPIYEKKGWGAPPVQPGDLETIAVDTDFLVINFYSRAILAAEGSEGRVRHDPPESAKTDIGWEIYPDGLRDLLVRLAKSYPRKPLIITENGSAWHTGPDADGRVNDLDRIAYLHGHLAACHRAIKEGVPLEGYFAWSLMDNFEWAYGYAQRFGLVHVDYETQQRTIKDSGKYYAEIIRRGGLSLG